MHACIGTYTVGMKSQQIEQRRTLLRERLTPIPIDLNKLDMCKLVQDTIHSRTTRIEEKTISAFFAVPLVCVSAVSRAY